MVCGVDIHRQGWMYFLEFLYRRDRNMRVFLTEMEHYRNLRLLRSQLRNAAAVIRHRCGNPVNTRGRQPRHASTETETNDADFAGLRRFRHCGADVEQGLV